MTHKKAINRIKLFLEDKGFPDAKQSAQIIALLEHAEQDAEYHARHKVWKFSEKLPPDNWLLKILVWREDINREWVEEVSAQAAKKWEIRGYAHWFLPEEINI